MGKLLAWGWGPPAALLVAEAPSQVMSLLRGAVGEKHKHQEAFLLRLGSPGGLQAHCGPQLPRTQARSQRLAMSHGDCELEGCRAKTARNRPL